MATRSPRSSPAVRAGIYTRISYDPAGQRAGVERQRLDCEALCRYRGWDVTHYLEDYADARVMPTLLARALSQWDGAQKLSA